MAIVIIGTALTILFGGILGLLLDVGYKIKSPPLYWVIGLITGEAAILWLRVVI